MKQKLFGTDGVRGRVGDVLTEDLARRLARAAAVEGSTALVGRDTRASGPSLADAIHDGLNAGGVHTVDLGVLPVGGVALLARSLDAEMAVMVSASHNPAEDNGIKFFGSGGAKYSPDTEAQIESVLETGTFGDALAPGKRSEMPDAVDRYLRILSQIQTPDLGGTSLVVDTANGAAFEAAPRLYRGLGAEVEVLNDKPTGLNINQDCGAVHPGGLQARVAGRIGFAFDGDADRCIAVDESGALCDGDVILAVIARHLHSRGMLTGNRVVTTVMANLGFRRAMSDLGIEVIETPVGDRHVGEAMRRNGAVLGGEQSGHLIIGDLPTGDGLLTALTLLGVVADTKIPLRELRAVMTEYPQVLLNVPVAARGRLVETAAVWAAVAEAEGRLAETGRVLVRESGTEPLVRVMVEALEGTEAESVARRLAEVVAQELG